MTEKTLRRPIRNFFVKRSMQLSIFGKILLVALISVLLTTMILAVAYNARSQGGNFYYMSDNIMEDLKLQSILGLVLPAVIAAQAVSLFIAIGIGLFSSRIAAVPIYKIENWAAQLKDGNLKTQLAFREARKMQNLTEQCNAVADTYRELCVSIDASAKAIEENAENPAQIKAEAAKLKDLLRPIQYT
jgi:hypothetical protein